MQRALPTGLGARPPAVQWATLLLSSIALVALLEAAHLPAALLLGAMIAAIAVAAFEGSVRVPRPLFLSAQVA
jgi:uncharacterized membrane protein AbrB (regulator of aidB expression)